MSRYNASLRRYRANLRALTSEAATATSARTAQMPFAKRTIV